MELSIFLAKFIGIYLIIFTLIWVVRKKEIHETIEDIFSTRSVLALSGAISLMLGIAIAIAHPIWELNWRGLITLFGYLAIFKGIIRIGFPDRARKIVKYIIHSLGCKIMMVILGLIGVYLTYVGFTVG